MTPNPRQGWTPKHYAFAAEVAGGLGTLAAWRKTINPKGNRGAASMWIARHRADWDAVLDELRRKAHAEAMARAVLTLQEKREFLAGVVRTPIGKVDETSPLAQEHIEEDTPLGQRIRVKMPDKLRAIELDSKLSGDIKAEASPVADALADLIAELRQGQLRKHGGLLGE